MATSIQADPEWCLRIRRLVEELDITQAALAERLGVSPATVSRWIQGKIEPTAEGYVSLGNLSPRSESAYFLERAGLDVAAFRDTGPRRAAFSVQTRLNELKVISSRKVESLPHDEVEVLAIPLLKVEASVSGRPHSGLSLADAEVEDLILVPLSWCPHHEAMLGVRLADDCMSPVISPGSILFVDTEDNNRETACNCIVLMGHRDLGFRAARLQHFGNTDLLIGANSKCPPTDVSNASKWKLCGRVLWWLSRDEPIAG